MIGPGFEPDKMCVTTLKFIGTQAEVTAQEKNITAIAKRHGGMVAGEVLKTSKRNFIFFLKCANDECLVGENRRNKRETILFF